MQDKDYRILTVEPRNTFTTAYGEMQGYALKLEGVEEWVQLAQKPETPAPVVGQTLHGHTYQQGNFTKFKKVNPNFQAQGSKPSGDADMGYVVKLLEAIAKAVGAESAVKGDNLPDEFDDAQPIDLSEIPF